MPRLFKEIVEQFGLQPAACSKYRRFLETTAIVPKNADGTGDVADV
jgi:hypothetical protein